VPARRAGLLCTVFVPETKRIDLDEAALHSESHFGKFMRSIGRPQARPQRLCLRQIEPAPQKLPLSCAEAGAGYSAPLSWHAGD